MINHFTLDLNKIFNELVQYNVFKAYHLLKFIPINIDMANYILVETLEWFKKYIITQFINHKPSLICYIYYQNLIPYNLIIICYLYYLTLTVIQY